MIVGAYGWDNGLFDEGTAFVFLGNATGVVGYDSTNAHAQIEGQLLEAFLGNSVADAGDVNGDGFGDILFGARIYPGSLNEEGVGYLFRGSASGIVSTSGT